MKLSELIAHLQSIQQQVGSHPKLDDSLELYLEADDPEDAGIPLAIASIDADRLMGCGCWVGAILYLKKVNHE